MKRNSERIYYWSPDPNENCNMVITTSIVVYSLHVSSQLEYFLFHLCNVHIVTVIQLSLHSLKNLGLENNREKEDKT